jgi:putative hydrolase of HD superfamily
MNFDRDLEFLFEVGSLRNTVRAWRQHLATDVASDLEHTYRMLCIALILARRSNEPVDELKLMRMALLHDAAETRTSDLGIVQKVYVTADEPRALHDLLTGTVLEDLEAVVEEYGERKSIEAKLVKDADNLDVELELKELEERGHQIPRKWLAFRRQVRDTKLYTEVAKKLWDQIQTSDPADWHLATNKWVKLPNAGR